MSKEFPSHQEISVGSQEKSIETRRPQTMEELQAIQQQRARLDSISRREQNMNRAVADAKVLGLDNALKDVRIRIREKQAGEMTKGDRFIVEIEDDDTLAKAQKTRDDLKAQIADIVKRRDAAQSENPGFVGKLLGSKERKVDGIKTELEALSQPWINAVESVKATEAKQKYVQEQELQERVQRIVNELYMSVLIGGTVTVGSIAREADPAAKETRVLLASDKRKLGL